MSKAAAANNNITGPYWSRIETTGASRAAPDIGVIVLCLRESDETMAVATNTEKQW